MNLKYKLKAFAPSDGKVKSRSLLYFKIIWSLLKEMNNLKGRYVNIKGGFCET